MKSHFKTLTIIFLVIGIYSCSKSDPRELINLNGEWKFSPDQAQQGIIQNWPAEGIPENLAQKVMIPHTWNTMQGLEKYWGWGWYQRVLDIPENWKDKSIRLQFDAVYHDAIVWVNGGKAGEHLGSGYNRFFMDITGLVKPGQANSLVVLADNTPSRKSIPFLKSFDWAADGGITRNVLLVATEKSAIANIQINGIPELTKLGTGRAIIHVSFLNTDKVNYNGSEFKAEIREENQKSSKTIWQGRLNGTIDKGFLTTMLHLENIHWWHFDEPNLYRISVSLVQQGKTKDIYTTTFGFRSVKISGTDFLLNGERMRIAGLEWMPGSTLARGMAETKDDLVNNLKLMKNVNAIYTRFHWQQDEFVFDWCDRNGILVQEEIPYWGSVTMLNDTLLALGRQQLDEMAASHFNHPSIISWGIGNELSAHDIININALKELYHYAKSLDSSRLVNYVSNTLNASIKGKTKIPPDGTSNGDVMMFNEYYSTWCGLTIDAVPEALDRIHSEYQDKPLVISEFGLCEPVHKGGDQRRAKEMTEQFKIYGTKPFIAGAIYFCLNDYRTHMGEDFTYSYPQRIHGIVDIHLKPKASYDTLKELIKPLEITSVKKANGKLLLEIKGKTGIPSYTVRNYIFRTRSKSITLEELKPGQEKSIELNYQPDTDTLLILRPTGFKVVSLPL